MILSHVWDYSFDPQTNIVDVLVSRLRDKIDRPFEKKLLHTVRGRGVCPPWPERDGRPLVYGLAPRRLVRDAVRRRLDGDRAADVLARVGVARAARSADHRQQARRLRGGVRSAAASTRSPRRSSGRAADRARAAVRARRGSRRRGDRPESAAGLGRRVARNRIASGWRTARSCRWGRAPRRATTCSRGSAPPWVW